MANPVLDYLQANVPALCARGTQMTVTILLDHDAVPERGTFTLSVNRSVEIEVTAEEARRRAKEWLIDEISYMMTVASPTLVVGDRVVWRIPALLTAPHVGTVGVAGDVDVDVQTGEIHMTEAQKAALLTALSQLAQRVPPYTPRQEMPVGLLVSDLEPTRAPGQPSGNPLDFLSPR